MKLVHWTLMGGLNFSFIINTNRFTSVNHK